MSERTEAPSIPGQGPSPSLRLLAAERLSQLERDVVEKADASVDLRAPVADDGLQRQLAAVAASLGELARTTQSFQEQLTGRHLDYSDQVRRLVATSEQALTDHRHTSEALAVELRSAVSQRDDDLDRLGSAVGHISRDLAAIIEQVMTAVRQSRELTEKNDELSGQFLSSFQLAIRHLAEQGQVLRGEVDRLLKTHNAAPPMPVLPDVRAEMEAALDELREELRDDLSAIRKLLSRPDDTDEGAHDWRSALADLRTDITSEMESWARELHDDQALVMQELLTGQKELVQLRKELSKAATPGGAAGGQLETEMSRLLIELRALRRRPLTDRVERAQQRPALQGVTRPARTARPVLRPRPKRA
jgi:DNA repair exonuclease SbcCD ATPase subunit